MRPPQRPRRPAARRTACAAAPDFRDAGGLHVISFKQLDARLLEFTVTTKALAGPAKIRILLPTGYDPRRRYPVFYLLNGTSGRYAVRLHGERVDRTLRVAVGADRRLRLDVPLGPANPYQAETPEAAVAGTKVFETTATITRVRGRKRA